MEVGALASVGYERRVAILRATSGRRVASGGGRATACGVSPRRVRGGGHKPEAQTVVRRRPERSKGAGCAEARS